jgi:hypothetical protein
MQKAKQLWANAKAFSSQAVPKVNVVAMSF